MVVWRKDRKELERPLRGQACNAEQNGSVLTETGCRFGRKAMGWCDMLDTCLWGVQMELSRV